MDEYMRWGRRVPSARAPSLWPADVIRHLRRMLTDRARGKSLAAIVAECRVGDIIEFSGAGLAAAIQEATTASHCSHVGMVVDFENQLCVLHATPHRAYGDLLHGGGGLYICPLQTYLPHYLRYEGIDIWHRALLISRDDRSDEPWAEQEQRARRHINDVAIRYARDYAQQPFNTNPAVFVSVAFPLLGTLLIAMFWVLAKFGGTSIAAFADALRRNIYCSQVLASIYVASGVFSKDVSRTHIAWTGSTREGVAPADFTARREPCRTTLRFHGDAVRHLPFTERYSYGPETCGL